MSELKYNTFTSLANDQKDESVMIIYDTASGSKFHGFSPLQLFAYMLGYQPWAVNTGMEVSGKGNVAFVDAEWLRDSHAALVKQKNQMDEDKTKKMVDILAEYLKDEEFEMV